MAREAQKNGRKIDRQRKREGGRRKARDGVARFTRFRVSAYENEAFEGWRAFEKKKKKDISESICQSPANHSPWQWCLIKMLASFSLKRARSCARSRGFSPRRDASCASSERSASFQLCPSSSQFNKVGNEAGQTSQREMANTTSSHPAGQVSREGPRLRPGKPNDGQTYPHVESSTGLPGITHSMNNQASLNIRLTSGQLELER